MINAFRNLIADKFYFLQKPLTFLICGPIFFLLIGLFAFRFQPSDPDLWWHLNVGRDIAEKGIQYKDIYSFTLPSCRWVDHEWLLNYLLYFVFSFTNNFAFLASFFGLAVFWCMHGLCSLERTTIPQFESSHLQPPHLANEAFGQTLLLSPSEHPAFRRFDRQGGFFALFPLPSGLGGDQGPGGEVIALWISFLFGFLACFTVIGFRAQAVSLVFLSILICWVCKPNWYKNKIAFFTLPLLFLLWANLHGGFLLGIVLLWVDLIFSFFYKPTNPLEVNDVLKKKILLILACLGVSLINPYGWQIYNEIYNVATDHYAHQWIQEWRPPDFSKAKYNPFAFYMFTYLLFIIQRKFFSKEKFELNSVFICSLIFLLFSFRSVRHISIFVFFSLPFYAQSLNLLLKSLNQQAKTKISKMPDKIGVLALLFVSFLGFFFSYSFTASRIEKYAKSTADPKQFYKDYPLKAIKFLQT
ncbi:MAG: hypothetical protein SFU25_02100, partial [Candidatus Caenarcaniphilales bacterium]|nr:hypothetical protein [Candidatus Caenarcaniphilales bacterium]